MKKRKILAACSAIVLSTAMTATSVLPAFAADLSPKYTYNGGGVTFEKISHADTGTQQADELLTTLAMEALHRMSQEQANWDRATEDSLTVMHLHLMGTGFISIPCTVDLEPMQS